MDQFNDNGRKMPVPPPTPVRAAGAEGASVPRMPTHMMEGGPRAESTSSGEIAGEQHHEQPKPALGEDVKQAKDAVVEGAKDMLRDATTAAGSYQRVKEQVIDSFSGPAFRDMRGRMHRAGTSTSGFISANALPLSMMGMGLGWLMLSAGHRERMARAKDAYASDLYTREVGARVMQGASEVRRRAADLGHNAYDQLGRAGSRIRQFGTGSPMVLGLFALAVGIGTGLLLPTTRRENRLMGDTRDRLLDSARDTAAQLRRGVERSAGELKEAVSELGRA